MAEDMPGLPISVRQQGQPATLNERLEPNHRIVSPIWPTISLPPGGPHRVGTHAKTHAELEQPSKGTAGWHANHQPLQNAELGIGLHDANQAHDRAGSHQAVGIEHQHVFMKLAPTGAKVFDVAGLVSRIVRAPAIRDGQC